ncbi:MAG TPA: hypothetical protein VLH79_13125 [Chthonomonadales bacterium]|nr:hypothetical protein [Chthonomonadales bacterium]
MRSRYSAIAGRAAVWACGILAFAPQIASGQGAATEDYQAVTVLSRREADQWLKDQITRAGGDVGQGRYHFVIGLKTSHFALNPLHGIAMRRLAFHLVNNTLTAGDQVSAAAWEMSVWRMSDPISLTHDPARRAAFVDQVPYAPSAGNRGGHDTERALYDVLMRLRQNRTPPESTVILLLTNTNQSQAPTRSGVRLFGADNPRLLSAIRSMGYGSPVRHTFMQRAGDHSLTIDVTALFPRTLQSLPTADGTPRYPTFPRETWQPPADQPRASEVLPNPVLPAAAAVPPTAERATPPEEARQFPLWLLLLLAILAALLLWALVRWLMGRRRAAQPASVGQAAAGVKGRPIPWVVRGTVGLAPSSTEVALSEVTTTSRWRLLMGEGPLPAFTDDEKTEGVHLATLSADEKGAFALESVADTLFQNTTGYKVDVRNPRRLVIEPEGIMKCEIAAATGGKPTPLTLRIERKR